MSACHEPHATPSPPFGDAISRAPCVERGWREARPGSDYRPDLGLDTAELFTFIGATQADEWDELVTFDGGDPDAAQREFAERVGAGDRVRAARSTSSATA